MNPIPEARCPLCGGPITFLDVLSIITPFQSVSCVTCGEDVFLKNKWGITVLSFVFFFLVSVGSLFLFYNGRGSYLSHLLGGLGLIVFLELVITGMILS